MKTLCAVCGILICMILISCAGGPPEPVDMPEIVQDAEEPAPVVIHEAPAEPEPVDVLNEAARLWREGRLAQARGLLWSEEGLEASRGAREEEWAVLRGRFYIRIYRGAALGLASENVSAVLPDGTDVWAGTWTGGISRLAVPLKDTWVAERGEASLAVRTVNRFRREGGGILAVRYASIETYNLRNGTWSVMEGLPVGDRLQDWISTNRGTFLASLGDGLWVRQNRSWRSLPVPGGYITRLESREDRGLLVGTMDKGPWLFEDGQWHRPSDSKLKKANITSLTTIGNLIIIGTYGDGAYVWEPESGRVRQLPGGKVGDDWVPATAERDGWVYFGTFGTGLTAWHMERDSWDSIGLPEGLPSADITDLAVDEFGALWAGTLGGGLIRLEKGIHGAR